MPLVAHDEHARVLDATREDVGQGLAWQQLHRVRPRPLLTCLGCGRRMHAKVSPRPHQLRFFAHDAANAACPLAGETLAHRLLKVELASALRDAGWDARLEVAGDGWRADVLATNPARTHRMAWEAQLSPSTVEELRQRTELMRASGLRVCWVADRDVHWLGHVPTIQVTRPESGANDAGQAGLTIAHGVARLETDYCDQRDCEGNGPHVISPLGTRTRPHRCPGHGSWHVPPGLTLARFVRLVCHGEVQPHQLQHSWHPRYQRPRGRRDTAYGAWAWTAPVYAAREDALVAAGDYWRQERQRAEQRHAAAIEAVLTRQQQLVTPTAELIYRETGTYPRIEEQAQRRTEWAKGVPVYVAGVLYALICPVANQLAPRRNRLAGLVLIAASEDERRRLRRAALPRQRIDVLTPQTGPSGRSGTV